jgi:hypothetical protein
MMIFSLDASANYLPRYALASPAPTPSTGHEKGRSSGLVSAPAAAYSSLNAVNADL